MKTEGGKPNEWSKDYSIEINPTNPPQDESFQMRDRVTRLNFNDTLGSMAKEFQYNRATYSGPLEPDVLINEEMVQLMKYELKAHTHRSDKTDDSDGAK